MALRLLYISYNFKIKDRAFLMHPKGPKNVKISERKPQNLYPP